MRSHAQTRARPTGAPREGSLNLLWGLLLTAAGVVLLLQSLDVIPSEGLLWTGLFGAVGLVFGYVFVTRRAAWWAAIPAGVTLGLAAASGWGELGRGPVGDWGGAAFLGLTGLGFWAVYARDQRRWWAVIPGGVVLTLAAQAALEATALHDDVRGALFFLGLGATFLLLAALPTGDAANRWAYVPGGLLVGLAVLVASGEGLALLEYLWPAALITAGVLVLWRTSPRHHTRRR